MRAMHVAYWNHSIERKKYLMPNSHFSVRIKKRQESYRKETEMMINVKYVNAK